jgi:hypothetical protein
MYRPAHGRYRPPSQATQLAHRQATGGHRGSAQAGCGWFSCQCPLEPLCRFSQECGLAHSILGRSTLYVYSASTRTVMITLHMLDWLDVAWTFTIAYSMQPRSQLARPRALEPAASASTCECITPCIAIRSLTQRHGAPCPQKPLPGSQLRHGDWIGKISTPLFARDLSQRFRHATLWMGSLTSRPLSGG